MTLMLPELIDTLQGRGHTRIVQFPGVGATERAEFFSLAAAAEKFDFGDLQLEPDGEGSWLQPDITPVEEEAWGLGLIPMPAPVAWFEFRVRGFRSGLIVAGSPPNIRVQRVDFQPRFGGQFTGVWVTHSRSQLLTTGGQYTASVKNNPVLLAYLKDWLKTGPHKNLSADYYLAVYYLLMLASRTTEIRSAPLAPEKLNRARIKRGDTPLPPHRIVTIVPHRYRQSERATNPNGEAERRAPRLHWRRSHLRHYDHETPAARHLASHEFDGRTGWWVAIIPRSLVGLAEAEVSHEYRIAEETP